MMSNFNVIISGAGPVGLFLANELALARCSVLVLEKAADSNSLLKQLPFGIRGLSAPTIEALYCRGLLDELDVHKRMKNPFGQPTSPQAGHFAGIPFHYPDIDRSRWLRRLPSSPPTNLLSEMAEVEAVLTRRALSLGVQILRGVAVADVQQLGGNRVQVNKTFEADWLVGCDGARSAVRKACGFEFAGTEPEFTGYTVKADVVDAEKLAPGRNVTERGMYFQTQPGHFALQDFDGGAFHSSEQPITLKHVQDTLRRISGTDVTLSALHVAASWTDRARQATSYRNGRVLLAGDAAHIHSPLGGQGLNLGLGDAMNLGWKLAATVRGRAPEGLLDTYELERMPIGQRVLDWSRAQVAVMRPNPEARALQAIFRDLIATTDGATYFAGRVWGIHNRYDLPEGGHALVGYGVPNFQLPDGTCIGEIMRDGHGILLAFAPELDHQGLQSLVSEFDGLKFIAERPNDDLGLSALLVRPDGIVAYATDSSIDLMQLRQALSRWFSSK